MNFILNDILWWKISLHGLINGWIPGFLAFFMGMFFNKISEQRKLKRVLKNKILEIFIAVFNVGETVTLPLMEKTRKDLRNILNTYDQVHPSLFNKEQTQRLRILLNEDLIINGKFNENYLNPEKIKNIIKEL